MEYHSMTIVELKQHAKNHTPKIKQYYTKKRHELIEILTMQEFPDYLILEKKKRSELIQEAKAKGYTKLWSLKKSELLDLLYPSAKQDDKNNYHAKEHDDPKHCKSK